jgi:hypothetical protein
MEWPFFNGWDFLFPALPCRYGINLVVFGLGPIQADSFLGNPVRRFASLVLFGVSGYLTGYAITALLLAFVPRCGYDCENHSFTVASLSVAGSTLAFLLAGYMLTRGARLTVVRTLAASAALAAFALLAASGRYVYELHAHYQKAEAARPVVADFDFMYMAIATRDVQTYTKAKEGTAKLASVIPRWQRCLIDGAWCDGHPKQAHMRCKSGVVYVNEPDWNAFSLIPQENLPGAIPMQSMNLCARGNVPDP